MKNLGTEFKVGLFTLVGLIACGYLFVILSPDVLDNTDVNEYYTILNDASGIIPKTHVKTNGVSIGKVRAVKLDVNRTKVFFGIDASIKLPKSSTMDVKTVGLLGDKFLEVIRGEDTGEYVKPGGFVPKKAGSVGLDGLISEFGSLGKDVRNILSENRKNVKELIANLNTTSETIRKAIGDREQDIQGIVTDIREFTASLREVLDEENRAKIDSIIASFDDSMLEVKAASKSIRLISDKVESGEGTIGKLVNDDETIVEIEEAIKDLRKVLAPVNKLQVGVDIRGEAMQGGDFLTFFDLRFQTRPDRFYILGLSDRQYDETTTTTENLDTPIGEAEAGSSSTTKETVERKDRLRFNLQIGKRWYNLAARIGLFESSGGVAADYYLFKDRLQFTIEAFDWKAKDNSVRRVAHFKTYMKILFFNHIYLTAGVDDVTKLDEESGEDAELDYFVGAGMFFNDQDLKALFGMAALAGP